MASKKISQREARQTRKQLNASRDRYNALMSRYSSDYPGASVRQITLTDNARDVFDVVSRLGFGIAGKLDGNTLKLYAVKP